MHNNPVKAGLVDNPVELAVQFGRSQKTDPIFHIGSGGGKLRMQLTESITVETDRFEHREVKPHFINPCCFGEDFAAWLKQEISHLRDFDFYVSEIIQEDYGWGFWASHGKDRFWVALSYAGEGPQEAPAQWVISVSHDPGLSLAKRVLRKPDLQAFGQLRDRVWQIVTSSNAIKTIGTLERS